MNINCDLNALRDRFESANEKILHHPSFDDEARAAATHHSATYMLSLTAIIDASDGGIPDDALPALKSVTDFLDLVEEHCASDTAHSSQLDA